MRFSLFLLVLGLVVPACDGTGKVPLDLSNPGPVGGGGQPNPPGAGPAPAPSPAPGADVAFEDDTLSLNRPGAFPSDLVRATDGTVYTVDGAQIPANVVAFRNGAETMRTSITAADLADHDGTSPAASPTTFGTGLFGAFTGDLELVFDRWLLVTVSAGNSISDDGQGNTLRLANLVVIDTETGSIVQAVNLAWPLSFSGSFSDGPPYSTIPQSLPAMAAFVADGPDTGAVYVAMSNAGGTNAGLTRFFNGTVQIWRADFGQPQPLQAETVGKAALDATRTLVSLRYNTVGLTRYDTRTGRSFLLLTNAGASRFDENFNATPTTNAFLEVLDLSTRRFQDAWAADLGPILPAAQSLAIDRDATGRAFALLGSQTFDAAYAVELEGLEATPVDPARIGLLRTVEFSPGGAVTPGAGFLPGVGLSPGGRTAILTSFQGSSLRVLLLPDDLATGPVGVDPAPFAGHLGPARGLGLGALVTGVHGATFVVNGDFDTNFNPNRSSFLGTLRVPEGLE